METKSLVLNKNTSTSEIKNDLLDNMLKINLQKISKQIYDAVSIGKITEVKNLLQLAEKIGITHVVDSYLDLETGNTALHEAALLGNEELINLLLEYGANPNKTNKHNQTPLQALNKKTTNQSLKIILNKEKISVDTSVQALSPFGLQHRQEIKTYDNKIATVYGATSKGELCVWIEGSSEVTILQGIKNRQSLIESNYKLTNKKSNQIYIPQKQISETLIVKGSMMDDSYKPTKINCSADTLKDIFNVAFLQRIKIPNGQLATVYGIHPNGKLCCLIDGQEAIKLASGTYFQELIDGGYKILSEIGGVNESVILDGYKINILTINSDSQNLKKDNLIPFQKYNTPTGIATFYGLSDDNKAILLYDKSDIIQVIDLKEITPLFEETKEKLESIEEPILETNLKTLLGKLHKLYDYAIKKIYQEPFDSLIEADEAKTTLDSLNRILNEIEFSNEDQLKSELKKLLSERWNYIKNNPHLTYINNTKSSINHLCIHIAQIIDPVHRNEILIPTLKYPEDTNGTNINQLEFGQFILTCDGKQFIDLISLHSNAYQVIKQGQENYYQVSEFSEVLIDGTTEIKEEQRQLKTDEINRLRTVSNANEFINAAEKILKATKLTALGALQELRKGLLLGDVGANHRYEYDAGSLAYQRLVWFSEKYNNMPSKDKARLDKIKLNFMEGTFGDFINNRLLLKNAGKKNANGQLDAYYCLELNGRDLEEYLEYHSEKLSEIPMGSGLFAEIGIDKLEIAYKGVIEALRSPDICSEPISFEDDVRFFSMHKVEIDDYIKRILQNNITDEPSFLQRIKSPPFNIQQLKNVLRKYLDYSPEVKSKLIDFILHRPSTKDLCLKRINEISRTHIDENIKLLAEFLLNRNLGDIRFSEDYLKIISKFTDVYGNNANKIIGYHIRKIQYLTPEEHAAVVYLNNNITNEIDLLSDKNEDLANNNLLGMTCAENLLSKLFNNLLLNKLQDQQLNETRLIHSILTISNAQKSKLIDLIFSEVEKLDASKNMKLLIQKFILEAKLPTNEEIFYFNKLINKAREMKNLSSDLEKLIHLILNKESDINQSQDEYYTLVNKICSTLIPRNEILNALNQILSKKLFPGDLKIWLMDFAKVMIRKPEGSITEVAKLHNKNNFNELIKPIINDLKNESISLQDIINLQDLIHKHHELLSSLEFHDINEIVSKAAIGLHPIIKNNLISLISETRGDNYDPNIVEKRCKEINIKILLSHHIIPELLDQHNSIYNNPAKFKALMFYLNHQSLPEKTPENIITELELFPNKISEDIKKRITTFLNNISKNNEPCLHVAEKIRLEHCRHEELRKEATDFLSNQIHILEDIQKNHNFKNSSSSFARYNAAHHTIFKDALGDKHTPDTFHHLCASLGSGTIKLGDLKSNIETITQKKLMTPLILLNKKTRTIDKLRHWIQNTLGKLNRLFFMQPEASTINIKNAQYSIAKNCNAFFSKAMQKDWAQPEEKTVPTVAITA